MTTALATTALSLAEITKRLDPDGTPALVAELLSKTNQINDDAVYVEGNLVTGNQMTIRTGLPTVYYRSINAGIPASTSTVASVTEGCSLLEAQSSVDVELLKLSTNPQALRLSEDSAFIEAMGQKNAYTMFYGNAGTDPRSFTGLAVRYSSLSAGNAQNIIDAGGTGTDNTSIYLVVWGENTVFNIYPKGTVAGLETKDFGEDWTVDSNNYRYRVETTQYIWRNGLAIKDWRYAARACNIDVSNLVANSSAADLADLLDDLLVRIPNLNMGRAAFYVNRTVYAILRKQSRSTTQNVLTIEQGLNQFGNHVTWLSFCGVPLRCVDEILNTEARVV